MKSWKEGKEGEGKKTDPVTESKCCCGDGVEKPGEDDVCLVVILGDLALVSIVRV